MFFHCLYIHCTCIVFQKFRLHNDLRQKEAELQSRIKELKNIENKLQEQQAKEEEFHRKATLTVSE